ncbi:MAG TPA: hypothetical protein PKJ13_11550 [bacterium]|nr:hypothetical protein [bacterium]HOC25941.1 hypothetical protein [bacterium]HOH06576.1 hypothetical protein [bacterium]HOY44911.1 hypothetical protein [bacterium]HPG84898.1 hypothetical protein [bacterium]
MRASIHLLYEFGDDEGGQTIAEYALILLLIMVAAAAVVALFGGQLVAFFNQILAVFP